VKPFIEVRFQVLTAESVKMTVFWVDTPRGLLIALTMQAAGTFETMVNFYQPTWRNYPEDSHLNLFKSFISWVYSVLSR
jgi:hypothetical protein